MTETTEPAPSPVRKPPVGEADVAAGLAEVRAGSGLRGVADESVTDLAEAAEAAATGAIDAATLKLSKVGGPTAALEISAAVPAYLSSALDSLIGIAAAEIGERRTEIAQPGLVFGPARDAPECRGRCPPR